MGYEDNTITFIFLTTKNYEKILQIMVMIMIIVYFCFMESMSIYKYVMLMMIHRSMNMS